MTSDLERAIREALGVDEKESLELTFTTPQFERTDDIQPADPSSWDRGAWEALRDTSPEALEGLGCRPWEEEDGEILMLFPGEWYDHIPDGYEVLGIMGDRREFEHGRSDNDIRFGCLAYGVVAETEGDDD